MAKRVWFDMESFEKEAHLLSECPAIKRFPELVKFLRDGIGGIEGIYEFWHVATGHWKYDDGVWRCLKELTD